MKLLFSGGGTLGSVAPLLAVKEITAAKFSGAQFLWVGTADGPEQAVVEAAGLKFYAIPAGKWRRYWSFANINDIFKILAGFFKSLALLKKEKPDGVITAGGFVSVPVHCAAWWLGVPAWVHQQDVQIGLANKLMFPLAAIVTTALQDTAQTLVRYHARWLGNPCRNLAVDAADLPAWYKWFNIPLGVPVILFIGGGTGSLSLNRIALDTLPEIPNDWHVIHLTGLTRSTEAANHAQTIYRNYHLYTILKTEMPGAYALASIVVARAGMGTLTELASLSKPAIVFPKTETHQELNAQRLGANQSILVLNENEDNGAKLGGLIKQLIAQRADALLMGDRLHRALPAATGESVLNIVESLWSRKNA